ncbi:MAG: hypothetical protein GEV08_15050 [Acidimicrobiia bacterium]|nr:hypothetical protein [Acidimicrobiia bacterium]
MLPAPLRWLIADADTSVMNPATSSVTPLPRTSRAVLRMVEAGSYVDCTRCGERVKFQAKMRNQQVICNVYENEAWLRVEHFHHDCYVEAGSPYGEVGEQALATRRAG